MDLSNSCYTVGEDTEDDDEQLSDAEEGDDAHTSDSSISSLGLSSGESKDQCPICLMTLKGQKLGKPNCCQHIFCLDCIQEWAKVRRGPLHCTMKVIFLKVK